MLAAAGFSLVQGTEYSATSEVLLNQEESPTELGGDSRPRSGVDAQRFAETQADLAQTPPVAREARRKLNLRINPEDLLDDLTVEARPESDILVFDVRAETGDEAIMRARAFVDAYVAYKRRLDTEVFARAREGVRRRIERLEARQEQDSPLFRTLVDKEEQLSTLEALQTANATVVRRAQEAEQTKPRPVRNAIAALILGVLLAIGLGFLLEALDTRLRAAEDVAEAAGVPLLGRLVSPDKSLQKNAQLVMQRAPNSPQGEAFRVLRTNLEFQYLDAPSKTMLVTSAVQGEGKSTTAGNLAIAFAMAGRKTLLVDCDLRRPAVHRFFGRDQTPGLSDVALRTASLESAVHSVPTGAPGGDDGYSHLDVLTAGSTPPAIAEFVGHPRVASVLELVTADYEVVIIDAPPVLAVNDALTLSAMVPSILLIARLGIVRRAMMADVERSLRASTARGIGVVVTGIEEGSEGAGYGYGYGYGMEAPTRAAV